MKVERQVRLGNSLRFPQGYRELQKAIKHGGYKTTAVFQKITPETILREAWRVETRAVRGLDQLPKLWMKKSDL